MFLETICILQGEIQNREGHQERMQRTASHFGFKAPGLPDLLSLLATELQISTEELRDTGGLQNIKDGIRGVTGQRQGSKVKCRIVYHESIREISFERYIPKLITSLKLVEASLDYSFKLADRSSLNDLLLQKGTCDEILITRNGFITDTSYSNVVLSRGEQFFTPENPLLNGTKRQKLLREGFIMEKAIHRDSLRDYDRIYLINAMLDIEDNISLSVLNVIY